MISKNLSFIIIFLTFYSYSQNPVLGDFRDLETINILLRPDGREDINLDNVNGSPYLDKEFKRGMIYNKADDDSLSLYIRYNVFSDNFELKYELSDKQVIILERTNSFEIEFDIYKFVFLQSKEIFSNQNTGYVSIISSPDVRYTLFKRYISIYTPAQKGKTSYEADKPAKVETKYSYYLKDNESNTYKEIEAHKKRILDALPENKSNELKSFIKENNLKFRGSESDVENDLKIIVNFLNTL